MTQGEPLQEGLTPPADQVEEPLTMASTGELAQDDAVVVTEGDGNHDPVTDVAGETEASARQTSPGNSFALPPFFYHLAPCFWLSNTSASLLLLVVFACIGPKSLNCWKKWPA